MHIYFIIWGMNSSLVFLWCSEEQILKKKYLELIKRRSKVHEKKMSR